MKSKNGFRKATALCLTMALCLGLAGCGGTSTKSEDAVAVQSVAMLMGLDLTGTNRYSGLAEAKSSQKVEKDADKTVDEVCVEVGQEVHTGDVLFRYDTEALQLSVESKELEVEQLENSISSYDTQISELEKEKKSAAKSDQLSYTLQIQEARLDKSEAQYNLKQKQAELAKLKKSAENTEVKAEVDGVVQSINDESSGDSYNYDYSDSGSSAYITIMETGTYRIKGTASENNIYELYTDMPVTVMSRTDASKTWSGTISEIDTGSTDEGDSTDSYYDEGSSGESTAKYSFYVTLEDSEGMMMGQHFYIIPYAESEVSGIVLPADYLVEEDGNYYAWVAGSKDTLEKRELTVGTYDEGTDSYEITAGLSMEDYVAVAEDSLKEGAAVVKYDLDSYGFSDGEELDGEEYTDDGEEWFEEDSSAEYWPEDEAWSGEDGEAVDGELFEDGGAIDGEPFAGDDATVMEG